MTLPSSDCPWHAGMGQRKRHELIRDNVGCSTCGVGVGEMCHSRRGSSTVRQHSARYYAATLALCTCSKESQ